MSQPLLRNYERFKGLLASYRVSEESIALIRNLKLVLLLAPSSGGRNTIIRELMRTGRYHYLVSDTTRAPRINDGVPEENGREYWFKSEEEVLDGLEKGQYLEAELLHEQQVSGISIDELIRAKDENRVAITDVDIKGVHNIIKVKSDAMAIMVLPPNFEEWQKRMSQRGVMSPSEQARRLQTAERIFEDGLTQPYYKFVINENVQQAAAMVDAISQGKHNPHQDRAREVIHNLQARLKEKLTHPY